MDGKAEQIFPQSPKQTDFITNHIKNLNIHENTLTQVCAESMKPYFIRKNQKHHKMEIYVMFVPFK